jgi:phenylalanyl-tRNA synthetase beta chain
MRISYDWLKEFIEFNQSPEELSSLLTGSGLEVESVEKHELVEGGLEGIIIGEVLTCEKHPDADKLSKTTVDLGNGQIVPIVCGAPNVAAGQKVVVATIGATMYPKGSEPFKIKKSKIRGEVSEGMICAEDELGLGDSHDGILVLETQLPNGTPAAEYFSLESDYVLEIGLTPNRGDAASHFGVARDLKALINKPVVLKDYSIQSTLEKKNFSVEVLNPQACIRYCGVVISGISISESPEWLKNRLKSIGLSPINNVVDITNFILHDLGQPLHAFDLDKIKGDKIIVRNAESGKSFTTLDGINRKLVNTDLVIANSEEAMCLAGVFGGKDFGVSDRTTGIFLESACFSPDSVRKASTVHGIKTDSSFRFERGTDPEMPPYALAKAVSMMVQLAGGEVSSKVCDIYPTKIESAKASTSSTRINRLIGKEIPESTILSILENLDIKVLSNASDILELEIPAYRIDVKREADIIEEIIRIYGYDNIEISEKINADYLADFPTNNPDNTKSTIGQLLASVGYTEIITNSLTKPEYSNLLKTQESDVLVLNKLSEDLGVMRQSLLFSGLEVVSYNLNRKQKELRLFEFGKIYFKTEQGYKENEKLALFIVGNKSSESWNAKSQPTDFYDLKADVHRVLEMLNLLPDTSELADKEELKYGLTYKLRGTEIVSFGLVKEKLAKTTDIKQAVWYAEFNIEFLIKKYQSHVKYEEVSKYPEVRRDLSLVLDKNISFEQIRTLAERKERKLLKAINVFDLYEGQNIGEGKKSYSISFMLQDKDKTLNDVVIDQTMDRLVALFEKELGAIIRK